MAYEARFVAYSGSDWIAAVELIDAESGSPLEEADDALIELAVRDRCNSTLLSATTADDTITRPDTGQVRWRFTASQMGALCPGMTYGVGLRLTNDVGAVAVIAGSLVVLDGEFS